MQSQRFGFGFYLREMMDFGRFAALDKNEVGHAMPLYKFPGKPVARHRRGNDTSQRGKGATPVPAPAKGRDTLIIYVPRETSSQILVEQRV